MGEAKELLAELGIEVKEGLVFVQKLTVGVLHATTLEVGSKDSPLGITIYDRATQEPVCIYSENTELKMEAGRCKKTDQVIQQVKVGLPAEAPVALISPDSPMLQPVSESVPLAPQEDAVKDDSKENNNQ